MPGFELFSDLERKEVNDVLETGVLMRYGFDGMRQGHFKAKELEREIEKQLSVEHAQVLSSGTAAVTTALAIAGVGAGDEVIMPTFTFVATFEAILAVGAIPVPVEIDKSLTLDPLSVELAITPKTKAIMPVHMCGSMADLDALKGICDKHGLLLIEDACQAIGGTYNGKTLGTIGDVGCFSFDYVKTVTCGEGGAIVTNNKDYLVNADRYTDHGHDHVGTDRGAETHPVMGYNFRISELNAAVGLAQMRRLPEFIKLQKRNYNILREALSDIKEVEFRQVPKGGEESYAFLSFFLSDLQTAQNVAKGFKENGIDACFHYLDNNWHYIRKWNHLKQARSLAPLSKEVEQSLRLLQDKKFLQSDAIIGRNISCLVKLGWSEAESRERGVKMREVITSCI